MPISVFAVSHRVHVAEVRNLEDDVGANTRRAWGVMLSADCGTTWGRVSAIGGLRTTLARLLTHCMPSRSPGVGNAFVRTLENDRCGQSEATRAVRATERGRRALRPYYVNRPLRTMFCAYPRMGVPVRSRRLCTHLRRWRTLLRRPSVAFLLHRHLRKVYQGYVLRPGPSFPEKSRPNPLEHTDFASRAPTSIPRRRRPLRVALAVV